MVVAVRRTLQRPVKTGQLWLAWSNMVAAVVELCL